MKRKLLIMFSIIALAVLLFAGSVVYTGIVKLTPYRPAQITAKLDEPLKEQSFRPGAPVFIRIFKQSSELELWLEREDGSYALFKTWPVCAWSGKLGPKLKEGDKQSPEGFYTVAKQQMNPNSSYHLSFNLGFPNAYDRSLGRTGSYLMVHGNCLSVGCYAMTDAGIEEIYTLADTALNAGQKRFSVHAFPFRMTDENMEKHADSPWYPYWQNLKEGYDAFEKNKRVPEIAVRKKQYVVTPPSQGADENG